ncbi:MAG: nucleoside 2-deoxyribosyltransferase [Anaerofustis stercorihominis]|nr:nucleoside 2-deoxyribosyltransferase [Anaerofustis stercorihominis]
MKKIYFCASVTGGRDNANIYYDAVNILKEHFIILTEHLANKNLTSMGENDLTRKEIYERDIDYLNNCDFVIAECSTPSLGVGYELCYAEKIGKPSFVLFKNAPNKRLSAMIEGNEYYKVIYYDDISDALGQIITEMK